jgi:hypothetical protein
MTRDVNCKWPANSRKQIRSSYSPFNDRWLDYQKRAVYRHEIVRFASIPSGTLSILRDILRGGRQSTKAREGKA